MEVVFKQRGGFTKVESFLKSEPTKRIMQILEKYAQEGVRALAIATPKDTGETSESWSYEITSTKDSVGITWINTNYRNGAPIAILLQYGHATRQGGYVQGLDYINPVIKPIFDKIEREVWREVVK